MTFFNNGTPRLATLDPAGSGSKTATYYLPVPDDDGVKLEWIEKSDTYELVNGSEGIYLLGYLPELTITWSVYDDKTAGYGYQVGSNSGNQLDFASLMTVLATSSGFLSVSPGPNAGGFIVNKTSISPTGVSTGGCATNLSIVFRGTTIQANRLLGAF